MKIKLSKLCAVAVSTLMMTSGIAKADVTLTFSSWVPWGHPMNELLYIPWMEDIERDSGGSITFKRLPKPIASPPAHLDAVRTGQVDVGFSVHGYSPKRFAPYLLSELPLLGDTGEGTSVALQRTHDKFFADKGYYEGVHLIGVNTHGPGALHHKSKHITTPEDLAGSKIRTGGPIPLGIVEAWGGVSIRQPAPKSYEILSSGIADGVTFPYESLTSFKIAELVPYTTYVPGGLYSSSFYLFISEEKYAAMTDAEKAVIDKHSGEAFARRAGAAWDFANERGRKAAEELGAKIQIASPELVAEVEKLSVQFEADYVANAEGVDGAAVLEFFKAEVAKEAGN